MSSLHLGQAFLWEVDRVSGLRKTGLVLRKATSSNSITDDYVSFREMSMERGTVSWSNPTEQGT